MFFDDRLATVLRHRATSERGARTQFRQLLDLLGSTKYGRDESLLAAAWLRLGALGEQIPATERAAMIRERGWRFRNPQLAEHLAEDEPEVVSAALSRADLRADEWTALIPRLPIRARGFLRLRRDLPEPADALLERLGIHDRGLPEPDNVEAESGQADQSDGSEDVLELAPELESDAVPDAIVDQAPTAKQPATPPPLSNPRRASPPRPGTNDEKLEIAALVERIAQFRRDSSTEPSSDLSPRLPLGERGDAPQHDIEGFGFASDADGRIDWADPEVAPMIVGHTLFDRRTSSGAIANDLIAQAIAQQQPIEGLTRALDGAPGIRGDWVVDAHPRFSRNGGRFHGYVGRFRRPFDPGQAGRGSSEADRMRQLLHELRTPVNAIQGFAELIHQQLYGPVPNAYRARAATIAGDAASILAGFDELERLAKLESGAIEVASGKTDLVELTQRMTDQLNQVLASRMAGIDLEVGTQRSAWVEIDHDEAEALHWRILATLAGSVSAGEVLLAEIETDQNNARLWCHIPAQLIAEDDVFAAESMPSASGLSAGLFGAGFSLRLARAEARGAGGDLIQEEERICLSLPVTAVAQSEAQDQQKEPDSDLQKPENSPISEQ